MRVRSYVSCLSIPKTIGDPMPPTKYGKDCALQFRARQQTWLSSGSSCDSSSNSGGSGVAGTNSSGGGLLSSLSSLFWAPTAPSEKDLRSGGDVTTDPMMSVMSGHSSGAAPNADSMTLSGSSSTIHGGTSLAAAPASASTAAEFNNRHFAMTTNAPATGRQVFTVALK